MQARSMACDLVCSFDTLIMETSLGLDGLVFVLVRPSHLRSEFRIRRQQLAEGARRKESPAANKYELCLRFSLRLPTRLAQFEFPRLFVLLFVMR